VCVLCGSRNKQQISPYTTLKELFFITDVEYAQIPYITQYVSSLQGLSVRFQGLTEDHFDGLEKVSLKKYI
jgi:hypothetical protein